MTRRTARSQRWPKMAACLPRRQRGVVVLAMVGFAVVALLATALLALVLTAAWYWHDLPPLDKATDYRPQQHLQVFTADGVEIAQFGTERRIFVPVAQAPKALRDAVLATEDADFYNHPGISFRGLARATLSNLRGGAPQGASTITQQVARTFFLSTRRTPERKIKEALLSLQLERRLGKDQILELYLNQIYLGQRAYGFGAAAQQYYGKPLAALNTAELAMLAGLPQNPIHANPITSLERATKRQQWVLARMRTTGAITDAEHTAALQQKLVLRSPRAVDINAEHVAEMARQAVVERLGEKAYTDGIRVVTTLRADDQRAAHAALRRAVIARERKQPWRGPEDFESLPDDAAANAASAENAESAARADRAAALALKDHRDDEDLRVAIVLRTAPRAVTAKLASGETVTVRGDSLRWLQPALSATAPEALAIRRGAIVRLLQQPVRGNAVRPNAGPGAAQATAQASGQTTEWVVAQWPQADAAFVALDPFSGRVRALVGGFAFNRQQFNRATSALRQPGSSIKPFLYSAALEHGVMPETLVSDTPLTNADGGVPSWNPQNSDGRFDGDISMREGLVRSKNLVSIRLLQQLGLTQARNWLARFGFDMDKQPRDLTLALGTGSVTPLQLASAYAVFANGGFRPPAPVVIERIVSAQGQVLFEAPAAPPLAEDQRVIPARNVFLVNTLLADVTRRGTAARAQGVLRRPDLYGKTGTTNDAVDAWFGGYAGGAASGVVAVAWMGHDDPQSLGEGESGGGLALPIWIDAMQRLLRGMPVQPLVTPAGVQAVDAGDWRYSEFAEGGFVAHIDAPDSHGAPFSTSFGAPSGGPAGPVAEPASAPR